MMGPVQKDEGEDNEHPIHPVQLDPYFISVTEITQDTWRRIMGKNPSSFKKGPFHPVERISWNDLSEFCEKTSLEIPTEAQWEKACRSCTNTKYYWGEEMDNDYCWYNGNSGGSPREIGLKKSNQFGLYDMCGNLWEWCRDNYDDKAYKHHKKQNPIYSKASEMKVRRGGSWLNTKDGCRCAIRQSDKPNRRASGLGARVSFSL